MMKITRLLHRVDIDLSRLIMLTPLLLMATFAAKATTEPALVTVANIETWQEGEVSTINCQISVPFLTAFSSESSAKLTYLLPIGSAVKQGQLMAEQQSYYYMQELSRLQQQLIIGSSDVAYHSNEYNRFSALKNTMASKATLENLLRKRQQSKATHTQIRNEIDELTFRINRLKFFAPKDGTIVETFSEPGEHLNQGTKVLSFVSQSEKEIHCKVPVSQFTQSTQATFSLLGDSEGQDKQPLRVERINQVLDNASQYVSVYLNAESASLTQFLGQRVKVNMSISNTKLTRLPVDGLNLANTGDFVWKIGGDGKVAKVVVKLLSNQSGYFLIDSSLKPGDQVVTTGRSGLSHNQVVTVSASKGTS